MGMNLFKKPNIADIFKPVVGEGSVYEQQRDGQKRADTPLEMTIVGKDTIDGQPAWWMEVGQVIGTSAGMVYSKVLVTKDFQFRKVVIQQPGQQAMEMPYQMVAGTRPARAGGARQMASVRNGNDHGTCWYLQLRALEEGRWCRRCVVERQGHADEHGEVGRDGADIGIGQGDYGSFGSHHGAGGEV